MFSGIIEGKAQLKELISKDDSFRMVFCSEDVTFNDVSIGGSIAVNGVCLTAVELDTNTFIVDVSKETTTCSNLGLLEQKSWVNIEKSLALGDTINGHFVFGHVDYMAEVSEVISDGNSTIMRFKTEHSDSHLIAKKGSIAINGVSLTVNKLINHGFEVTIIPHTKETTIMSEYKPGTIVNIEFDMLARYVERMLNK
jgi:riboflavin synthase